MKGTTMCGPAAVLAWGNYIVAWRDSEFATCMPTDWYSIYRTSPIRPESITQQLSRFFTFLSRTHRGSFADTC